MEKLITAKPKVRIVPLSTMMERFIKVHAEVVDFREKVLLPNLEKTLKKRFSVIKVSGICRNLKVMVKNRS